MLPHSLSFQLPRPSDHLISRARGVFFSGGLPQDGRADEQFYRIGERQRRLLRVSLVAHFDADGGRQKAGVPVAADGVEGRFTSEVGGTLQAVRGAARDVAHLPALRRLQDRNGDAFRFRRAVRQPAPQSDEREDRAHDVLGVVSLRRGGLQPAQAFGVARHFHGCVSSSFRHAHFRAAGAK